MAARVSSWRIRRASTGLAIHHAQRPEIEAVGGAQRHGDAKPAPGFPYDVRGGDGAKHGGANTSGSNVGRPNVGPRAGRKREPDRGQYGPTPCRTPLDFRRIEAVMRLEPDAVAVDEADDRDGDIEKIRGQRGDAVAGGFGRGIEDLVAQHRRKARAFVVDGHSGRGCENVETTALCWPDQMQHGSRPPAGYREKGSYVRGTSGTLGRDPGGRCSLVHNHEIIWRQACDA